MPALELIDTWPVAHVAAATVNFAGDVHRRGDSNRPYPLASISKVLTTWAALVAVEEGTVTLDQQVGQADCTLRHLLSHAGGYAMQEDFVVAEVGTRRIYSNIGIELAAEAIALAAGMSFADYLDEAVLAPLGMTATTLGPGSPAHGMSSTVDDLIRFVDEIIHPTLLDPTTVTEATTIQFPELSGVVPGVGGFRPCPWGLGVEILGEKHPHWMGATNSPESFGHFGGAGTMLWVDPIAEIAVIALTDRRFQDWKADALRVWPIFSDAVLDEARAARVGTAADSSPLMPSRHGGLQP